MSNINTVLNLIRLCSEKFVWPYEGPVNMHRVISVDFRRYPFLVLINLNMLKQVPNPLLGLAIALASILAPNN
jgi:hypothetical protein